MPLQAPAAWGAGCRCTWASPSWACWLRLQRLVLMLVALLLMHLVEPRQASVLLLGSNVTRVAAVFSVLFNGILFILIFLFSTLDPSLGFLLPTLIGLDRGLV